MNGDAGSAAATAALRSIYSSTGSGQRALVFTVEVPERGPLGLDLKAPFRNGVQMRGAVVKGFRPNRHGKKGYIESTGKVKEKDILVQLHDTRVEDMPFDAIVDLAAQLQDNPMAWPLRLEFRREPEPIQEPEAKGKGFSGFLRSASMSIPGLSSTAMASPMTAPSAPPATSVQDGTFQDKLNYFRGFFKEKQEKKTNIPPLPAPDIVNDMYRELLVKRNVPDDVLDELIRIETPENKWSTVWLAKQHENDDNHQVLIADAIKIAESLVELHWDSKGLQLLENLHRKISAGTAEWMDQFVVSYGLEYLTMKMPESSPYSIENHYKSFDKASRFCESLIRILLSLSHFANGIDAITNTLGLVERLALCFHTESTDVKKITLQVLGIICYNSAEGHDAVVESFTNYKEVKGEQVRFACLVDALKSTRYNLLFKEDVMIFINILVNKALEVDTRIEIRQDFFSLGISEYFEKIRNESITMYAKTNSKRPPRKDSPSTEYDPKSPPYLERRGSMSRLHVTPQPSSAKSIPPSTPKLEPSLSSSKPPLDEPLIPIDIPVSNIPSPVNESSDDEKLNEDDTWGSTLSDSEDDDIQHDFEELTPQEIQIRIQYDNLEKQIDVFNVFYEDDRKSTIYKSTDLSSLESVINSLMERIELDDELRTCFLSILQQLLFIPANQILGKEMWAMCERVTKEIALLSPVEEVRRYELSFEDRKRLLSARDKFTAYLHEKEPGITAISIGPIDLIRNHNPQEDTSEDDDSDDDDDDRFSKFDYFRSPYQDRNERRSSLVSVQDQKVEKPKPLPVSVKAQDHPDYVKFFKLLKMGMPLEHVKLKASSEGIDSAILDSPDALIPLPALEVPQEQLVVPQGPVMVPIKEHPDYAKYFKLMKMGMPAMQVELKMNAEGVDATVLSTPDKLVPIVADQSATQQPAQPEAPKGPVMVAIKDHPKYAKFFKLMKMGMPAMQVELKMKAEGFDPTILSTPDKMIPENEDEAPPAPEVPAGPVLVAMKDHPKYAKFFKLLKMGMPQPQIELKMQAEGFDPAILSTPDKMIPEKEEAPQGPTLIPAKDHPKFAKYFKLMKMGMPAMQVELKMKAEGLDPAILATPDKEIPENDDAPAAPAPPAGPTMVAIKDHPKYAKYFKLMKMGMPAMQVELKMKAEGLDTSVLSTPDKMIPENDEAPAAPAAPVLVAVKDHPKYAKFFKLMKMGMPAMQVELKMKSEGLDATVLSTPDKMIPENDVAPAEDAKKAPAAPAEPVMIAVKDHPKYAKFFKLANMGMPAMQVELKMKAEGLDPTLMATPDKKIPEKEDKPEPKEVLVKDHPDYAKYLKLQKMGMPQPQIELKMKAENLNPELLATPDSVVPAPAPTPDAETNVNVAINVVKFVTKVKAKPKLRNLYWEPVVEPTQSSLWSQIGAPEDNQKELDALKQLTTLFSSAPPPEKEKKKPVAKKKAATRVALIDVKRANNLGIMLARFRLPYAEIKRAVLEIDREVLTTEKIAALIQFAPENEELEAVKAYTGEPKLLGDAEQYFLEISTVPRYASRLQAVLATFQFDSNVEEQRRLIESVNSTCAALRANKAIPEILKLVLVLGNTLNEGTARGGAQGFKLSILLKLVQVKASDNSMTLLNYLAIVLRKKNPEWLTFTDSLESLEEASRVTTQVLNAGEAAIRKASKTVVTELEAHSKLPNIAENDKFQEAIAPFAKKSEETSEKVAEEYKAMTETFKECVRWFGEDPEAAGCGPDSFFSIFVSFGQMLQAADRDNERKRIAEEKRIRREAETRKRMEQLQNNKQQRKGLDSLKQGDAHAIVKKIRGKRCEEKRKELLEQATSNESFCSTTSSRQLKSVESTELPPVKEDASEV